MPAQNHVVSGNFDRCIAVPAVSKVCRPQSRHSNRRGRLFKATARPPPQAGQTKPSRQRRADRNASQRAGQEILAGTPPACAAPRRSRSEPALASSAPSFRHYVSRNLSQRDKPLDGWKKTATLTISPDDFATNAYPGTIRPLLMRKGKDGDEEYIWDVAKSRLNEFRGRTVTCEAAVWQKQRRNGSGTWQLLVNDDENPGGFSEPGSGTASNYEVRSVTRPGLAKKRSRSSWVWYFVGRKMTCFILQVLRHALLWISSRGTKCT